MRFLFLSGLLLTLVIPLDVGAQWQLDGALLTASSSTGLRIEPDGSGGAITVSVQAGEIFAQRVDASGVVQWTPAGVEVCAKLLGDNSSPALCPDGNGGAFFTWLDTRDIMAWEYVYAQHVDAAGVPQGPPNGAAMSAGFGNYLVIVSDGAGGAIIMWQANAGDIYAQKVDALAVPQWGAGGVNIGTATTAAASLSMVADGAGGAIVAWTDFRGGGGNLDVYAQRVDATGTALWTVDGVLLSSALGNQFMNDLALDDNGGAILTWFDASDIYAQKVDGAGMLQWLNGVPVCLAVGSQSDPVVASDGAGGAILAWQDARAGVDDIYAQRLNLWGVPQWAADGIPLCAEIGDQQAPEIVADGGGGATVVWRDFRTGDTDVLAQRVNAMGVTQWTLDGVSVCSAPGSQSAPAIASDDAGGAIVAWSDGRPNDPGEYAQRITYESGLWGRPEAVITSVADVPADQGGRVRVNWEASRWDVLGYTEIVFYSVWRATEPFPLSSLPAGSVLVEDPSRVHAGFSSSAYWVEQTASEPYYWEWLGNQAILNSPGYSFSAATRADSTLEGSADHYFQVVSHTDDPFVFWRSNVATGYSVDNLAPPPPLQLTVERLTTNRPTPGGANAAASAPGDVLLHWKAPQAPDLRDYSIYRSTSDDVEPTPMFFLASTDDTLYVDTSAPTGQSYYYVLTANDVHGNSSAATGVESVGPSTGVTRTPPITALTVLPNHPNPFAGTTELEIGLVASSSVQIDVYDVAGRVVRRQVLADQSAGWLRVSFDGRNDEGQPLASGVYFCRVAANGATVTRKMVIAR